MRRAICAPGVYVQGGGELAHLADQVKNLGKKSAYLIVDSYIEKTYRAQIVRSFEDQNLKYTIAVFGGECSMDEIRLHQSRMTGYEMVFGIGGGKALDTAKATAFYRACPVVVVPTVASNDSAYDRLAVIYTAQGAFSHYMPLAKNPEAVVIDCDVIAKAPARFLATGIGDALATWYEADASARAHKLTMAGGYASRTALALAKLCHETLMEKGIQAMRDVKQGKCTEAVEDIIEANTYLSGIGFESGGLSGAHAVHNGLTVLEETHVLLHGEKVAYGVLTQLALEKRPLKEIQEMVNFCKELGLPVTLRELGLEHADDARLMLVAEEACKAEDNMGNMPFAVTPEDVVLAMRTVDLLSNSEMLKLLDAMLNK